MSRLANDLAEPSALYADVMLRIRQRFDIINALHNKEISWSKGEIIGTNLRKIIEGIAFGCVIAFQHSSKNLPREVAGQWNAETIFVQLGKIGDFPYPDPNEIRAATETERKESGVQTVLEGQLDRRISVDDLRAIYRRTHPWAHENNPYVTRPVAEKDHSILLSDARRVEAMLRLHRIGINGESFICTIRDSHDGQVKIQSISKIQSN